MTRKRLYTTVSLSDYGEAIDLQKFLKLVNDEASKLTEAGWSNLEVGLEGNGQWAEDGQHLALFASMFESDEQFDLRCAETAKRSAASKKAWEKRRACEVQSSNIQSTETKE